jgi:glycine oxidase
LYLARSPGEAAALAAWAGALEEEGIRAERLSAADLCELEPGMRMNGLVKSEATSSRHSAFLLPDEAQLRNPRYLKALVAACRQANVTITPNTGLTDITTSQGQIVEVTTIAGPLAARQFCFTTGAWTGVLLQRLGISAGIVPIRGQIVLFKCNQPPIARIINEGSRYLVPRDDGYVLAGSTEEEAGFDKRTTDEAIADLVSFARGLVPALRDAKIERTWAGLRPGSFDGLPYLGPLPGLSNAFIAAGHFRTGLYLSPATAVVMSQLLRGEEPQIDLAPFRVGR